MWKNLITPLTPIMLIQVALTLSWSLFPINTMQQHESHYFQVFDCHVVQVERWFPPGFMPGVHRTTRQPVNTSVSC